MIKMLLDVARRHIILFGAAKFGAGLLVGFALGVYFLPILTAEKGLDGAALAQLEASAERSGTFTRDLAGSDAFHWGEGVVHVSAQRVWLDGRIAPGPDYRLYMTPEFVQDEAAFLAIKARSVDIGPVRAFTNFDLAVPSGVEVGDFPALLIWCEAFGEFITAARLS
ncbi:MAG: DM13 domain-containing protein [Pseudomonadota bacterium]|nr:DM13 domain-containing protein [Pseudomonadota bacterium]